MIRVPLGSNVPLMSTVYAHVSPADFPVAWSITAEGAARDWQPGTWMAGTATQLGPVRWRATTLSPLIGALPAGLYELAVQVAGGAAGIPDLPVGYLRVG